MTFSIAMLIFGNEKYIVGSIISAYIHKKYINKLNLDIDLIIMVDDKIYQYKDELLKYFNKVIKINILELKINYNIMKKYSKWMEFLINKWQILKYDEYEKILFVDPDFLPLDEKFYSVFDLNTPAVSTNLQCIKGKELNKTFFMDKKDVDEIKNYTPDKYYNVALRLKSSINATLIMLKPDKKLYEEYIKFIKKAEEMGYKSTVHSGVDETSLLLFLRYYKDIPIYCISKEYSIAPWDDKSYDINNIYGLNYVSMIKPWLRLPFLQWSEENIWHIIAKNALVQSDKITEIYINGLLENLEYASKNYQHLHKNSGYNLQILKSTQKELTMQLFNYVNKNKGLKYKNKQNIAQIQNIMNDSKKIHSFMKNKSILNYDNILKLL